MNRRFLQYWCARQVGTPCCLGKPYKGLTTSPLTILAVRTQFLGEQFHEARNLGELRRLRGAIRVFSSNSSCVTGVMTLVSQPQRNSFVALNSDSRRS
ncbi:hypothetical protein VFPPC_17766 [Pochonia chlamydosporia 170]|uniref:Uncharacterized protein n=1 Tax=Pochonia chlamydosporia 170 TaxID=1380566 RepID=A0A219AQJ7_METCM|nr:hypothetical protein VFPPC_17766 [Pochonia chlamydosporia 170]OWT43058.1 hypothetical protein VFPPC_17766 [Pochonia chlamydosporia 170]